MATRVSISGAQQEGTMKSKKKDKKDKKGKGVVKVINKEAVVNFWEIAATNNTHQLENVAFAKGIG